jgi:sensor domain CHASE-containing protein/nitrogen-specific signal transduction histidine kinase
MLLNNRERGLGPDDLEDWDLAARWTTARPIVAEAIHSDQIYRYENYRKVLTKSKPLRIYMEIRKTVLIIIIATTLFLVLLIYGTSETLLLGSFSNLEEHSVLQNVNRVQLALNSDIDHLNTLSTDWSQWNDTYAFISNRNQNYITSNLPNGTISQIRLNVILFIDSSGQLVFGRLADLDTKKEMPVSQDFLKTLFSKGSLICHNESDVFKGIVLLPDGPLIISSRPILTSEGKGPIKGTLIIGQNLKSEMDRLSETTQLPIVSHEINDLNMPSDFAAVQSSLLGDKSILAKPLSKKSIAGYAILKDVYGNPAMILRIDMIRDIYEQGLATINIFALSILIIGIVFGITIVSLLDRTFLSKLTRLSFEVQNIGLDGVVSKRIQVAGNDEISSLSNAINNMLDRIAQFEGELKRAHDELDEKVIERTVELEARNAEMERFVYTVSHELRSPLISISGLLGLIEQDCQKGDLDRLKADIRITNDVVGKMDGFLTDTLELSRIGRVMVQPDDVPFSEIVSYALGQTDEKIRSRGVKVSVDPDMPIVHVDRMRIVEVLINLIENSVKYMGDQPTPEIEIGKRLGGEEIVFFVRDNGIGIDPSQHEKVFGLFYRLNPNIEGTGAGLAIVKRIIEVQGGSVWVESELGKGCTVCFTLPLAQK